jgi:nitrogen fixation protein NifB
LLPNRAQEIIEVGIDSLTVTVNAVDPSIEAKLCESIFYKGVRYTGEQAAELLIKNQLEGIKLVSAAGITVKVNTVLAPGINDHHIADIAKTVAKAGAKIYNIIPLIPQGKLANVEAPTCAHVDAARCAAEPYIDVFRHCQHCRADAIGIPGESDFGEQIYLKRVAAQDTFSHG